MDFTKWGKILYDSLNPLKNEYFEGQLIVIQKPKSDIKYYLVMNKFHTEVEMKIDDKLLLSFKEELNRKDCRLDSFTRKVKNHEYIFEEGKVILKKLYHKKMFFKPLKLDNLPTNKIITMDLETRAIDGYMWPYCTAIYDGKDCKSFYQSNFKDSRDMLENSIKYLMREKYNKHKVYLHNFSYFDAIFMINLLTNFDKNTHQKMRDDKIIDFKFHYKNNYYLNFRDSLLLLPESLAKLAKAFNFKFKGKFPYNLQIILI